MEDLCITELSNKKKKKKKKKSVNTKVHKTLSFEVNIYFTNTRMTFKHIVHPTCTFYISNKFYDNNSEKLKLSLKNFLGVLGNFTVIANLLLTLNFSIFEYGRLALIILE